MAAAEDFIDYFESREGIVKIMMLSDDQFRDAWALERSLRTQTESEYENVGFEEVSRENGIIQLELTKEQYQKRVAE